MPATYRSFAEQILFGETLADKLVSPDALEDCEPGPVIRPPSEPGRPEPLRLTDTVAPFPTDHALADPTARGHALHYFANHELLALELMALALLRYIDAPPAFRRGLVATMRDEQRHLSLYLERMRALGTDLGDVGVGGYFWRAMSDLGDPAAFVSHMSLTFEQANLDHARYYAELFRRVGDEQTAAVMDAVYADEIRHVGLGVRWMERWHPGEPLLEVHRRTLRSPVTLRRARGRSFDAVGRRAAGLSDEYIERMALVPTARSRPPVVHLFDPTTETELAHGGGYQPDARTKVRTEDLETLPLLYAPPDDIVLVRKEPSLAFLRSLREAGWSLAEPLVADIDGSRIDAPSLDRIARVQPWGWTARLAKRLAPLRSRSDDDFVPEAGWSPEAFDKVRALSALEVLTADDDPRLSPPQTVGRVASSFDEVLSHLAAFAADWATVAIKARFGTAGRGTIRVRDGQLTEPQRGWIRRTLARQGAVIVEPWLDRVFDLSVRFAIDREGEVEIEGVGRFVVDPRGQYLGAVLGRLAAGMPSEVVRWLHGDGKDPHWLDAVYRRIADAAAYALDPSGYVGTVGVDAFVYRDGEGNLRLRPLVEINPRVHMGHVAVHLARRLAPGAVGLWWLRRRQDVPEASLAEHAARLHAAFPVQTRGTPPRITGGVLATTDPGHAQEVLALLSVARTLEQAATQISAPEALVAGSSPMPTSESRR